MQSATDVNKSLISAVKLGNSDAVIQTLRDGADINTVLPEYESERQVNAICVAAFEGQSDIITLLQNEGCNHEHRTQDGLTAIHIAAHKNHPNVIGKMADLGVDLNIASKSDFIIGITALHIAAYYGHSDCLKILLEKGADVDPLDATDYKRTPLMFAAALSHVATRVECMRILIDAGADAGADEANAVISWRQHLHRAAEKGELDTLKYIIGKDVDPDSLDIHKQTPMDIAQVMGLRDMADWLNKYERPERKPLPKLDTHQLLDVSRKKYEKVGNSELKKSYTYHKIPEECDGHYQDEKGWTYLHHATSQNNIDLVNNLLDNFKVAANVIAYDGSTPADVAKTYGHHQLAVKLNHPRQRDYKMVVEIAENLQGINPSLFKRIKDTFNQNHKVEEQDLYHLLVHKICQEDNVEDVVKLANLGCPVSPVGNVYVSALMLAINLDRKRTTTALIALGSEIFCRMRNLHIYYYTWRLSGATIFIKMLITRMFFHRIRLENRNTEYSHGLKEIYNKVIQFLDKNPERFEISEQLFIRFGNLKIDQSRSIVENSPLTSLLCEAVDLKCPILATLLYTAGAQTYTFSDKGKTAVHHTLDANTGMEGMILSHLGGSLYIADNKERIPIDIMQGDTNKHLEKHMMMMELNRLEISIESAKSNEKRITYQELTLLFCCFYVTSDMSDKRLTWKELYSYTLKLANICFHKQIEVPIPDDRLEWIGRLCEEISNQFENVIFDVVQRYEQVTHQDLINALQQLKMFITKITEKKYRVQTKDNIMVLETMNAERYVKKALEFSCENGFNIFIHMLRTQAKVNFDMTFDLLQTSALHHASAEGNGCIVAYLIHTCKAKIACVDRNHNNAAHYAYMNGKIKIGNYLINTEPKLNEMKNSSEMTPVDLQRHCDERVRKLKDNLLEEEHIKELKPYTQIVSVQNDENKLATILLNMCLIRKKFRNITFEELALENLVDFSDGENKVIFEEVVSYIQEIGKFICKDNVNLQGKLVPVGSVADGLRLGTPDEYDFNWVIEMEDIIIKLEKDSKGYSYKIKVVSQNQEKNRFLSGSNLRDEFHSAVKKAITTFSSFHDNRLFVILPGVKKTGVGVALTLAWMGTEHTLLLVDVDLVPVIKSARPEGYPHPPLTDHISVLTHAHTIDMAGIEWKFSSHDLDATYINRIDDRQWRFSQALEENYLMLNLSENQKRVFLICKYIISILRAEAWYPDNLKKYYKYFADKFIRLPAPQGFLLKSSFFKELDRLHEDKDWIRPYYLDRAKCIFLHMCRKSELRDNFLNSLLPSNPMNIANENLDSNCLDCGKVPSYFASNTEKPTAGFLAPAIFKFLNLLDIKDFVSEQNV